MDLYLPALMLLSGAAAIHSRAGIPELRPASDATEAVWKLLAKLAFLAWLGLLAWGWFFRSWQEAALGLGLSLLVSVLLAAIGPRPGWWAFSLAMAVAGLALGILLVLR
ncbi:multidrug DMT transporter permease [Roseomonas sp. E05]|uniref:multidrug DMT transporter permease n=1 Tax=Roseomonas sp. E05 TaxID=3046310 RepID=UPI0024BBD618|nr:multidrug DMT transporter permease [Roseomonas sp. E05]MDJ0387373.1 multidrug DMT transporter permease [Roseomonas sp. E05]